MTAYDIHRASKTRRMQPTDTHFTVRRVAAPGLPFIIDGSRRMIKRVHETAFRELGLTPAPNGCWYIPATLLDSNGKVPARVAAYLKRFHRAVDGIK